MTYTIISNKHYPTHNFDIGSKVCKLRNGRYGLLDDDSPWPLEQWINRLDLKIAFVLNINIKIL
jgi:hypothetical protein